MPQVRYDTSYLEYRQAAWDGYIEVRGNRYSVPAALVGQRVTIRIGLDGLLRVFHTDDSLAASHTLQNARLGWSTIQEHRVEMWKSTLQVEQRSLAAYEEVA